MKNRVQGSTPLPPHLIYMEPWAEKLTRVLHPFQIIQCELKMSNDRYGNPTGYFDKRTWFRSKIDYFRLMPVNGTRMMTSGMWWTIRPGDPPSMGRHPTDVERMADIPVVQDSGQGASGLSVDRV